MQLLTARAVASVSMIEPTRQETADEFESWLNRLQCAGQGYRDGKVYDSFGITYVADLHSNRADR
jgi:hypothetical protein